MLLVTLLLIALLILSLALLAVGFRGRRVDDHPICRRCGFDLFGLPAGSKRCSECGADLARRRATRMGRRMRRKRLVALGAVLLLPSGVAPVAYVATTALADPTRAAEYKPTWLLMREAERDGAPATRDAALGQVARRGAGDELDAAQLDELAGRVLARQADASRPWVWQWGRMFERIEEKGRFRRGLGRQFRRNFMAYRLDVRPRVLRGAPIVLQIHAEQRLGGGNIQWPGELRVRKLTIGPVEHRPAHWPHQFKYRDMQGMAQAHSLELEVHLSAAEWARLGAGTNHAVRLHVEQVHDLDSNPRVAAAYALPATLSVGAPVPTRVDPSLRQAVASAVGVIRVRAERMSDAGDPYAVQVALSSNRPPVGLAWAVSLRAGGREWPVGAVNFRADAMGSMVCQAPLPGFRADRADIVLRPSPPAAAGNVDIAEIWGEPLVIPDQKVTWRINDHIPTTTTPTTAPRRPAPGAGGRALTRVDPIHGLK